MDAGLEEIFNKSVVHFKAFEISLFQNPEIIFKEQGAALVRNFKIVL